MFDLPRKVKEFSCLCCGERFWTIEGSVALYKDEVSANRASKPLVTAEYSAVSHHN